MIDRIGKLLDLNKIKEFFNRSDKEQFEYTGLERTDGLANHGYNPFESEEIFDSLDDIVRKYYDKDFDAILRITHYPKIKLKITGNDSEGEGDKIFRLCSHKDYGPLTLYYEYTPNTGFQIFRNEEWIDPGSCIIWNELHRVVYTDPIKERWTVTYHVDYKDCKISMNTRLGIK